MESINEKNEELAKQVNYQYSSNVAKEEFGEWSEELTERADNLHYKGDKESETPEEKEKRLKEMDDIVKEDIKHAKR